MTTVRPTPAAPATSASRGKVIVYGLAFWYPLAGVTWQFVHFLVGLRRLGYDPYYVEDSGRWIYDPRCDDLSPDAAANVEAVAPVLERHGFAGRWVFRGSYPGGACYGMAEGELARLYRDADVMLNVTGAQELRDEHLATPRKIYVETDPVASQVRIAEGDAATIAALDAHDTHFTYGENLGAPDCLVPVQRYRWQPTRQPVVLDLWPEPSAPGRAYTTVATWSNKGKDITWQGETYRWRKDLEFEKFLDLPRRRNVPFELATGVGDDVRRRLLAAGWSLVDPLAISRDVDRYRDYIAGSRGEFTVAKDQNIRLRSGWFSDRSACYLAAGRPVLTQDTAFGCALPTGRGLFSFRTMDEVLAALDAIESDYAGHCADARALAAEYFAAEKVLGSLLAKAGL